MKWNLCSMTETCLSCIVGKHTCWSTPDRFKSACASVQFDQSPLSAWRNFASWAIWNAPSEDSDQTIVNCRLIWISAGRRSPKVHFLMLTAHAIVSFADTDLLPLPLLIVSQSDYLIQVVMKSHTKWQNGAEANWSDSTQFAKAGHMRVQQDQG